jgi:thiosulfate/3-mercaptopyruvate sulfurtransferase
MQTVPTLVETGWLAEHLYDPNIRIVDARWREDGSSRRLFSEGHIPGAVPLDWQRDLNYTDARGVRDLILPPPKFAGVVGNAGISNNTWVIAYAETDYSGAARLWWALNYYGHSRVSVLNGGFTKWLQEGRTVNLNQPAVAPAKFISRPDPAWLATAAEILEANPTIKLIDSRPLEQYEGKAVWTPAGSRYLPAEETTINIGARTPMRAGHLPGAVHWHATTTFDPKTWTLLPPDQLREMATARGITPEQRLVTYCGVGISASQSLLALYIAGFRNLALYDASWEEWGTDPRYPIETY